jgi:glutamate N-acetyltransferase/amino-acid N-acetyltransferase
MIAPNMATMLAFITTDADCSPALLRKLLKRAVNADGSFNRITVDSDTSTSDTVAIMANGASDAPKLTAAGKHHDAFAKALDEVCQDLAYQVISDGEGVNHVIRVVIRNAASDTEAVRLARSVADSPLVKTAVHGHDPNWGRIAMAVGKAGAKLDPQKMTIQIGKTSVYRHGQPAKFDAGRVSDTMNQPEVTITVDLDLGEAGATVLGCDLSRDYIRINADYTT